MKRTGKLYLFGMILVLLVPFLLSACGSSPTVTATATTTATTTATSTATTTATATATATVTTTATPTPSASPTAPNPTVKNPDTFIYATIGFWDSLDPAYAYDTASGEIIQSVYEPLISNWNTANDTHFDPVLATQWTISPDGKTYRFEIRQGVHFQNGDLLTPEDVVYSFERALVQDRDGGPEWMLWNPLFGPSVSSSRSANGTIDIPFSAIQSKFSIDGDWVQFNLAAPYPPFLQILTQTWSSIVDKSWCIANGDWDGTAATYAKFNNPAAGSEPLHGIMNGTGPYALSRFQNNVETDLVRNDNYWRTPASIKNVVVKVVDEWTTRRLMLEAGDADLVDVPPANQADLAGVPNLTVYKDLPALSNDGLFFQFKINPNSTFVGSGKLDGKGIPLDFFSDVNVRKGFAYAFDYDTYIKDALNGQAIRTGSPICKGLSYYDPNAPMYTYDAAKATEYFKQAFNGQVWSNGFTVTILYNNGNTTRKTAAEILQADLFNINPKFNVNIQVVQWSTMLNDIISGTLPTFIIGWLVDYPDASDFIYPYMDSSGTFSGWQGYNNPKADALIAQGSSTDDAVQRAAIYKQLDQIYYDDVPSVIIDQPTGRRYFRDWITGFYFNPVLPGNFGNLYSLKKGY